MNVLKKKWYYTFITFYAFKNRVLSIDIFSGCYFHRKHNYIKKVIFSLWRHAIYYIFVTKCRILVRLGIKSILPRLLQRSKECRGHYSTLYHATSQWIMRNDTHDVISSFDTMWRNPCIWSSKSCQLHVDFTFQRWCWPCICRLSMQEIKFRWRIAILS